MIEAADALDLVRALVAAAGVIVLPGLLVGRALGLRGLWWWALAPALTMSAVGVAALGQGVLGYRWSVLPVLAVAVAASLVLALARRVLAWDHLGGQDAPQRAAIWALGLGLPMLVVLAFLLSALPAADAISQTFDVNFHLNAIRYILQTNQASPLEVGGVVSPDPSFYPAIWHALGAQVVQMAGVSVPVAANALGLAAATVVWVPGMVLLARTLVGSRPLVLVGAGVTAALIPAHPYLLIEYGVLYPLHLGLSLCPAILAAVVVMLGLAPQAEGRWAAGLAAVGALPGLALTHPTALASLIVVAIGPAVVAAWRAGGRWRWAGALAVLGSMATLVVLRPPPDARSWAPTGTMGQAVGEVSTLALYGGSMLLLTAFLLWSGVVVAARERTAPQLAILAAGAAIALIYISAAGVSASPARTYLSAPWYNNVPRVSAVVPIVAVMGVVIGLERWWPTLRQRLRGPRLGAGLLVAVIGLGWLIFDGRALLLARDQLAQTYNDRTAPSLLSADERTLLRELPELVPASSVLVGDPRTGTALAYAIADRRVLAAAPFFIVRPSGQVILDRLRDAQPGSAVCRALQAENVDFVLDFGSSDLYGGDSRPPGLRGLAYSSAVTEVTRVGDARLYRVTGCAT